MDRAPLYQDRGGTDQTATGVFLVGGGNVSGGGSGDLDTNGDPVPTYKGRTFGYDAQNNLTSETVVNGSQRWVRTYTYSNGAQSADSGWVKQ